MKLLPLICWIAFSSTLALAEEMHETFPLWPEGKMPVEQTSEAKKPLETPSFIAYSTKGFDNHTGAAMIVSPGGGYGGLAKDHEGHQVALWFQKRGVTAYVLTYRLASQGYHHPAQLCDIQRAVRVIRARADQDGIDPQRIGVMGFSAGGHLSSMAATLFAEQAYEPVDKVDQLSARPDLAVLCYAVILAEGEYKHACVSTMVGQSPSRAAYLKLTSTDQQVSAETPPTFLFHTDADVAVHPMNAIAFYTGMKKHQVPGELHIYQEGPHGVGLYRGDSVLGSWTKRLEDWLRVQNFFAAASEHTVAVNGTVTLDGLPAGWGVVEFQPLDSGLPKVGVRLRNGKFASNPRHGAEVPVGRYHVRVEASSFEADGDRSKDAVIRQVMGVNGEKLVVEVEEGMEGLVIAVER